MIWLFPGWGIRVFPTVFEFAVGYGYNDALSNRDQSAGLEPCAAGDNVHRRPAVCVYPCNTGGLSRGKDFIRSDWPPGLCGRFGVAALIGRAWMARLTFRPADSGSTI